MSRNIDILFGIVVSIHFLSLFSIHSLVLSFSGRIAVVGGITGEFDGNYQTEVTSLFYDGRPVANSVGKVRWCKNAWRST